MQVTQGIRCPNCGSHAERNYLVSNRQTRTECPVCDYLMITCSLTGKVVEAYAPGIYPGYTGVAKSERLAADRKRPQLPVPGNSVCSPQYVALPILEQKLEFGDAPDAGNRRR